MATFLDMANASANQYGIPQDIFSGLVSVESGWNAGAVGSSGELGLAQVMPGTGADMGYTPAQLADPATGLQAGAQYLSQQYQTFGNWPQALSAYNAGPGNVDAGAGYASRVLAAASKTFNVLDPSTWGWNQPTQHGASGNWGTAAQQFKWTDPKTWWPAFVEGLKAHAIVAGLAILGILLIVMGAYGAIVRR